jgi:hypothetical protein
METNILVFRTVAELCHVRRVHELLSQWTGRCER